ncbi:hypothetical protein Ate01nite_39330 [Actinoplanes teichomyceticus]|nr:hypothetical protein Ate01nite_39330 [Actinoplanes teichomyceticus]
MRAVGQQHRVLLIVRSRPTVGEPPARDKTVPAVSPLTSNDAAPAAGHGRQRLRRARDARRLAAPSRYGRGSGDRFRSRVRATGADGVGPHLLKPAMTGTPLEPVS